MQIEHRSPAHQDARGIILDVLRDSPVEFTTLVTSKAGSVRGNHYHTEATVHVFILEGSFEVYSKDVRGDEQTAAVVGTGDVVSFAPYDLHALVALEDSAFLLLAHGKRGGALTVAETLYDTRFHSNSRSN